jgi:hypothetical protein
VTTIPDLESELRRVAERHYRRGPGVRRFATIGRRARAAVPVGVALGLLAAGVLLTVASTTETEPVSPAATVRQIEETFAIFRRSREPRDTLRLAPRGRRAIERGGAKLVVAESRLVAADHETRYFAVPADTARGAALCIVATDIAGDPAGNSCGYLGNHAMALTTMRRHRRQELFMLLPDGARSVELTLRDGERRTLPVHDNGVLATLPSGTALLRWTAAGGTTHRAGFHDDRVDPSD